MAQTIMDELDDQLKEIILNLYTLMVQSYEYQGPATAGAMTNEVKVLTSNLQQLSQTSVTLPTAVPPEIIQYIEEGRNPDIYTREFVELAQEKNQLLKGKSEAYAQFREALAREIRGAIPDIAEEVDSVVKATTLTESTR